MMTSIIAFFVLICVLVFVHEWGHFWAARRCGVKVVRFSIGFGKVLFRKRDSKGTEFAFSLIPLGGYVQMWNGEALENEKNIPESQALNKKSVLQRVFIILAGPLANFIFAILAYWVIFLSGIDTLKPVIGNVLPNTIAAQANLPAELQITEIDNQPVADWEEVSLALIASVGKADVQLSGHLINEERIQHFVLNLSDWQVDGREKSPLTDLGIQTKRGKIEPILSRISANSVAEQAGLKVGDKILSVNGEAFDWLKLVEQIQTGKPLLLQVESQGQTRELSLTPEKSVKEDRYLIGITPTFKPLDAQYKTVLKYDLLKALQKSLEKVASLVKTILKFIAHLITGELSLKNMGGPISIAKGAGMSVEIGLTYYLSFMALISVNLGVMNLFPILPLDGGQLVLLSAEGIRGKPLSEKITLRFQQLGVFFVLTLMIFAFFNDIIHF